MQINIDKNLHSFLRFIFHFSFIEIEKFTSISKAFKKEHIYRYLHNF